MCIYAFINIHSNNMSYVDILVDRHKERNTDIIIANDITVLNPNSQIIL